MSNTAKSAFVGYSYQFQVALMTVFLLEEGSYFIEEIRPEIEVEGHNFDDIWCLRKRLKKDLFIQAKNNADNNITFNNGKVYFNSKEVVLKENAINIIVTRNNHNLTNNCEDNNFKFYKDPILYLIVICLPSEMISGYIFSNFLPSRINQLISLADRKFTDYYSCVATENELPTLEFISSDLLEKTILIRNPEVNSEKVLFIVGKPGVGKSHLVNELKVPETQLYRFWIRNQDPERIDRLNYNTFLNQLSLKLFGSGRLRTEEEIISKFDSNGEVFYIDGLDHVENYNPIQIQYYFDFIDKINKTKSGRVVVLTRPLNQKIEYPIYQLQNWSPEETKEYL